MQKNNRSAKKLAKKIIELYPPIFVNPGKCRWNNNCHLNAVHDAVNNNDDKVIICCVLDTLNKPTLHCVNYHNENYIDNTLGYWVHQMHYRLIKEVQKKDFDDIDYILHQERKKLLSYLSWFDKLFYNYIP